MLDLSKKIFPIFIFVLLISFFQGPVSHAEESMINRIMQIELNKIQRDRLSRDYFGYIEGSIPILISAPHGAVHYRTREHRWKAADAYTSAIAIELGRLTGAHVLYLKNKSPEDPNNDLRSKYKLFLSRIAVEKGIKFIVDLHGAGGDRPFKVDIGILDDRTSESSCPTFLSAIGKAFRTFEDRPFNRRFKARAPGTITYFAKHTLGIEAAQIEINARYRMIGGSRSVSLGASEQNVRDLMNCLQTMIIDINQKIHSSQADLHTFAAYCDKIDTDSLKVILPKA